MEATIKKQNEFTVIGLETVLSPETASRIWNDFYARLDEIPNKVNEKVYYGICDDLSQKYIAGVQVSDDSHIPEGMISFKVPANEYAIFTHKGTIMKLHETFDQIGHWLSDNHYQALNKPPFFEKYDERFNPMSENSELEIHMCLVK